MSVTQNIFWKKKLLGICNTRSSSSRSTVNINDHSGFQIFGNTSTVCPSLNGRQTERNGLAVMLLTIVQTETKPTPITAAALMSKAHMPLTSKPIDRE